MRLCGTEYHPSSGTDPTSPCCREEPSTSQRPYVYTDTIHRRLKIPRVLIFMFQATETTWDGFTLWWKRQTSVKCSEKNWNMQMIFINYRQSAVLLLTPRFCSTSKIVFSSLIFFPQLPFLSNNRILANNHPEDPEKSYTKCRIVIKNSC